jgi:hypothetical protein
LEATVLPLDPTRVTESGYVVADEAKWAVTLVAAVMVRVHNWFVPWLAQAPPQPANVDPLVADSSSDICNPLE